MQRGWSISPMLYQLGEFLEDIVSSTEGSGRNQQQYIWALALATGPMLDKRCVQE